MTRLAPPARQSRLQQRPRLQTLLQESLHVPLTLVVAPAGSGKTVALTDFADSASVAVAWLRLTDVYDQWALLNYLAAACQSFSPAIGADISAYHEHGSESNPHGGCYAALDELTTSMAATLDSDVLLILDDYQYVDRQPLLRDLVEYFFSLQPRRLHILIATRETPLWQSLAVWQARGEVQSIAADDLAFTRDEAHALATTYGLTPDATFDEAVVFCRGWALATRLLADQRNNGTQEYNGHTSVYPEVLPTPMRLPPGITLSPEAEQLIQPIIPVVDDYLTRQVIDDLPSGLQVVVFRSAQLRWLDTHTLSLLPGLHGAESWHAEAHRRALFLEEVAPHRLSYQPLFRGMLLRCAADYHSDWHLFHEQAAEQYIQQQQYAEVLYHLLLADDANGAAAVLEQVALAWVDQGDVMEFARWLDQLPPEQQHRPRIYEARGAAARVIGNFDQALVYYEQAEAGFREQQDTDSQVRLLRAMAAIYLDTVQPAPAETLLQRAFDLLSPQRRHERIEILRLQAENWANRGRADVALELETRARTLEAEDGDPAHNTATTVEPQGVQLSTALLLSRLMLRSGRLNEALEQLEADLGMHHIEHNKPSGPVLAHREPALLLAFVYSLLGKDARALAAARRGLLEAHQSNSLLTTAIAHMRVAHAYQVVSPLDTEAIRRHYQWALELIEAGGVTRTKVEAFMGLALLHGHHGELARAEEHAEEALRIAEEAGDEWIAALVWLALGGAAVVMADERALAWLDHARERFERGGDNYGQAVVSLWLARWYLQHEELAAASTHVNDLLHRAREYSYDGLLTGHTLFGPRDLAMLIPILLHGRSLRDHSIYAQQLLRQAFPSVASDEMVDDYHPGYTLRIQMLGSFRVWRGIREIHGREWQREKARQLLQLLLTYRGQWLQREQICSWLWPDSDLESSERQFKVTLNALNTALEPTRPPRTMPFFVRRQGLAYSFAPSYGCWIDVDEFELRTTNIAHTEADFMIRSSQAAVGLYQGDYLAEALYDPWTLEERERLMARYLATATSLAEHLMEQSQPEGAIELAEQVLRRDRCYEEAYQVLMRVYARNGSRSQALRTYTRCRLALDTELDIEPLPETSDLYERIKRNDPV